MWTSSVGGSVGGNRGRRQLIRPVFLGATRGLFSLILSSLFPSSFTYVLLQHFRLLTGARGKVVMRMAVADRAGNDGSDGGSCEKLLGVFVCGFRGCGALSLRCWSCLATVSAWFRHEEVLRSAGNIRT
ncbi:hypothetical protein Taro_041120, partial [Colocasia esculenta]|nr:hypothetical protein [Colocasia esculenta]